MKPPLRILVTGSRAWTDEATIRTALLDALDTYVSTGRPVLVHGGCPTGADAIANDLWEQWHRNVPDRCARPGMRSSKDRRCRGPSRSRSG